MLLTTLLLAIVPALELQTDSHSAVAAYRAGDYDTATALWTEALATAEHPAERARLTYDLGNAAFRRGQTLQAIGWYTSSVRLAPRHADAWANLELARSEVGLEPADRGDLAATMTRLLSSLTLLESEWLVLFAILLLAAALSGEALRGGRVWRRLSLVAGLGVLLALAPYIWNANQSRGATVLVIATEGTSGRSEPRPDGKRIATLEAGMELALLDELGAWVKVEAPEGEIWVKGDAIFHLAR